MPEPENSVFKFFSFVDRLEVMKIFPKKSFGAGDFVYKLGHAADDMCIIVSGRLEALKPGIKEGESDILMTLNAGQVSGEMAFMNRRARGASVRAPVPTDVLCITREQLEQLKQSRAALVIMLYEAVLDQAIRRFRSLSDKKNILSFWL